MLSSTKGAFLRRVQSSFETREAPISRNERNLLFLDRANESEKHGKYRAGLPIGELLLRGTFVEKWRFLKSR